MTKINLEEYCFDFVWICNVFFYFNKNDALVALISEACENEITEIANLVKAKRCLANAHICSKDSYYSKSSKFKEVFFVSKVGNGGQIK